jgi:hypothetical protein
LDVKDDWVRVILNEANYFILKELSLIWEGIDSQVLSRVDVQSHHLWVEDEWRSLSVSTFVLGQGRFESEGNIKFVLSVVSDLELVGISLFDCFFCSLFWILLNQERTEVEAVFTNHEGLRQEALWLGSWSCLFAEHEHIFVVLADSWEFTDSVEVQVKWLV